MAIQKTIKTPTCVDASFHEVAKVEVSGDFNTAVILVRSYANEQAASEGVQFTWQWTMEVSLTSLAGGLGRAAIEQFLVDETESPFFGGNIQLSQDSTERARTLKWAEIKFYRKRAIEGGFTWNGMEFDSDPDAQQNIQGAALLALAQPELTIGWTLRDNTTTQLTSAELIALGAAMSTHINSCHEQARARRIEIFAAESAAEIAAVNWVFPEVVSEFRASPVSQPEGHPLWKSSSLPHPQRPTSGNGPAPRSRRDSSGPTP